MCHPCVEWIMYLISSLIQISRQIILSSLFVDGKLSLKGEIYIIQVREDPELKSSIYPSGVCFVLKLCFIASHCTPSFSAHCVNYPYQTMRCSHIFAKLREVYFNLHTFSHHFLVFSIAISVALKLLCSLKSLGASVKTQIDNPYPKRF